MRPNGMVPLHHLTFPKQVLLSPFSNTSTVTRTISRIAVRSHWRRSCFMTGNLFISGRSWLTPYQCQMRSHSPSERRIPASRKIPPVVQQARLCTKQTKGWGRRSKTWEIHTNARGNGWEKICSNWWTGGPMISSQGRIRGLISLQRMLWDYIKENTFWAREPFPQVQLVALVYTHGAHQGNLQCILCSVCRRMGRQASSNQTYLSLPRSCPRADVGAAIINSGQISLSGTTPSRFLLIFYWR